MDVPFPKSVAILGHTYTVVVDEAADMRDDGVYGEVNHRTQVIRISVHRPASQQMEAFIHELIHIVTKVLFDPEPSEQMITLLSEGLSQVLQSAGVYFRFQIKPTSRLTRHERSHV